MGLLLGDQALAVGGAGLEGDLGAALGEPLDFLELDAVPGRVADDGVEAPLPVLPDGGEGELPVQPAVPRGPPQGLLHRAMGLALALPEELDPGFAQQLHGL